MTIEPIAVIRTDFPEKFGIPRQSGLIDELEGYIIFESKYRAPEALREIERYTHLWLIWGFSENKEKEWSPTVRPPKLGGNKRVGVFATRSPYRPNPLGLSCVRLEKVEHSKKNGCILQVRGADLVDGTPIYDIKPYLPLSDCKKEASGSIVDEQISLLKTEISDTLLKDFPSEKLEALKKVLEQDPRPAYQDDPERIYGFGFAGYEIKFKVQDNTAIVTDVIKNG